MLQHSEKKKVIIDTKYFTATLASDISTHNQQSYTFYFSCVQRKSSTLNITRYH